MPTGKKYSSKSNEEKIKKAAKAADFSDPSKYAQSIATEQSGKAMTAILGKDIVKRLKVQ